MTKISSGGSLACPFPDGNWAKETLVETWYRLGIGLVRLPPSVMLCTTSVMLPFIDYFFYKTLVKRNRPKLRSIFCHLINFKDNFSKWLTLVIYGQIWLQYRNNDDIARNSKEVMEILVSIQNFRSLYFCNTFILDFKASLILYFSELSDDIPFNPSVMQVQ